VVSSQISQIGFALDRSRCPLAKSEFPAKRNVFVLDPIGDFIFVDYGTAEVGKTHGRCDGRNGDGHDYDRFQGLFCHRLISMIAIADSWN
jgi:hypothetical protein